MPEWREENAPSGGLLHGSVPVVHRGDNKGDANRALRLGDAEELERKPQTPALCK